MSDPANADRKLSEISHLFLSSIREKASNGSTPPKRVPPSQPTTDTIDLTPEELAGVLGDDESAPITAPVTAVIAWHLTSKPLDRVRDYARHLAADGSRVGLIFSDASEFRLLCFSRDADPGQIDPTATESFDPRRMTEALNELSCDVDRWLLLLPTPRVPEARALLRQVPRWLMLCSSDHEGVVACYRSVKGLADLFLDPAARPALSLALLDAVDDDHAARVSAKLAGVCQQFLNWPVETERFVRPAPQTTEQVVLNCRALHDKGQIAAAPQWHILNDFLARCDESEPPQGATDSQRQDWAQRLNVTTPEPAPIAPVLRMETPMPHGDNDVIDLTDDSSDSSILTAVMHSRASQLVECPIAPPMCKSARLAVGRDHRIVLVAVARQGLAELPAIGDAFRWLNENRALIGMAVPQLSIDATQPAQLSLLIDQTDSSASTLRPILQSAQVTVQTYRTLRWSGKRGLLLEAA